MEMNEKQVISHQLVEKEDIINIDMSINRFADYKELYSLSGFRKIVLGKTYTNIPMPKRTSKCKKKRIITDSETSFIRQKYNEGYKVMEIIRNWFPDISEASVSLIVHNKRHTNI